MIDGGLRNLFIERLPQFHWTRIETGPMTPGVPDANACGGGVEFWVECKRTLGWAVKFEPLQVSWIWRRVRAGGRVWIAVRRTSAAGPRRGEAVDALYIVQGAHVRALAAGGLAAVAPGFIAGLWHGGENAWDWEEIAAVLGEGRKVEAGED